jgi:hypothetical protein
MGVRDGTSSSNFLTSNIQRIQAVRSTSDGIHISQPKKVRLKSPIRKHKSGMRSPSYRDTFIKFPKYLLQRCMGLGVKSSSLSYLISNQCIYFPINNVNQSSILLGHTTIYYQHNQSDETQRVIRGGVKEHFPPIRFWYLLTIHYLLMCD